MKTDERLRAAARDAKVIFPTDGELPPLHPAGSGSWIPPCGRPSLHEPHPPQLGLLPPSRRPPPSRVVIAGVVRAAPVGRTGPPAPPAPPTRPERRAADARPPKALQRATAGARCPGGRGVRACDRPAIRSRLETQLDGAGRGSLPPRRGAWPHRGITSAIERRPSIWLSFADNTPDAGPAAHRPDAPSPSAPIITGASYPKAEQNVFSTCQAKARVPYQRLLAAGQTLDNSWWNIISRIQASGPVQAAIPALDNLRDQVRLPQRSLRRSHPGRSQSFADFMDWISGFLDGAGSRGASTSTLAGPHPALDGGLRHLRPSHRRSVAANAADRTNPLPRTETQTR